jgi:uncharacterized protein
MARYPAVGEVKTRLARTLGAARAAALYRAFLQDIERHFAAGPRTLLWVFSPPHADFASILAPGARCIPQVGADLGARLYHCFHTLCAEGFERVIVFGADVPHLRDEWLDEAEHALLNHDVVIGPAQDGGYYLMAMRAAHDLFSGIAMSTDRVLAQTLDKARRGGLRVYLLPESFDVDEERDLVQLRSVLAREGNDRLRCTAAVLDEWGRGK